MEIWLCVQTWLAPVAGKLPSLCLHCIQLPREFKNGPVQQYTSHVPTPLVFITLEQGYSTFHGTVTFNLDPPKTNLSKFSLAKIVHYTVWDLWFTHNNHPCSHSRLIYITLYYIHALLWSVSSHGNIHTYCLTSLSVCLSCVLVSFSSLIASWSGREREGSMSVRR